MPTTIQISNDVQKRLFQFINKMEKKLGRRVSYNEAIQYLLELQEQTIDKKKLIKEIEQYFGILRPGEGKKYLKELRILEHERNKRFNRD